MQNAALTNTNTYLISSSCLYHTNFISGLLMRKIKTERQLFSTLFFLIGRIEEKNTVLLMMKLPKFVQLLPETIKN